MVIADSLDACSWRKYLISSKISIEFVSDKAGLIKFYFDGSVFNPESELFHSFVLLLRFDSIKMIRRHNINKFTFSCLLLTCERGEKWLISL